MRDSSPSPGPRSMREHARRELKHCQEEIYTCYEKGLSVKETLLHIRGSCSPLQGGEPSGSHEALYLETIRELLVVAVSEKGRHAELASFFSLFDSERNSRDYRLAIFNSIFRNRLEHLLSWLPAHRRRPLEDLIGRPLRERDDYPPQETAAPRPAP